jgi:antitoxin component of MazEF toxin-antitoxin module
MQEVRERIESGGTIRVPHHLLEALHVSEGDEIEIRVETSRLVITPVMVRRKLRLRTEIVDEIVRNEESLEPELA